jgi:hypothetical protein
MGMFIFGFILGFLGTMMLIGMAYLIGEKW